jgi:formamidopyrimidine-DNA glycosylase
MPELPEVQALVADLTGRLVGREIGRLELVSFAVLKTFDPPASTLDGATITGVTRHGKFLDIETDAAHLIVHLARAGWLRWRKEAPTKRIRPGAGPIALRLILAEGDGFDLTEAGTKKSLAVWVVRDPRDVERIATLGPDPLAADFDVAALGRILTAAGRSQLKGLLRDQRVIAGIGNAYSDEILHVAKLSPFAPASSVDPRLLYDAMQTTLRDAIARDVGLPASELKAEKKANLRVHARFKEACPVCGDTIQQVIYSDSTFQYCPTCQTGGKKLSDRVMDRLLK